MTLSRVVLESLALLSLLAALALGVKIRREPEYVPPDSPMDDVTYDVNRASARAQTSGSDARAVAAEVAGGMAAEDAIASENQAERLAKENEHNEPFLAGTVTESDSQKVAAGKAKAATAETVEAAKLMQSEAVKDASAWAAKETDVKLADVYKGLMDWKYEVLHDPVSEAKIAAQKAGAPYEKAMLTMERRINEYQQRATDLQNQAYGLQGAAVAVAKGAVAQQGGGALAAAAANMKTAHHFMIQAASLGAQAMKVQLEAQNMQINFIPAYQGAQMMAAAAAAHRYNPSGYAPPPVAPTAFTPPGPGKVPPGGYDPSVANIPPAVLLQEQATALKEAPAAPGMESPLLRSGPRRGNPFRK